MKKAMSFVKKHAFMFIVGAFILGVGSISASLNRLTAVVKDPRNAVSK